MKAIQLLINSKLPEELRDPNLTLDAKSLNGLLANIARDYPERYEEISKLLSDVGRKASYDQGETIHLRDMMPVFDRDSVLKQMDAEIRQLKREDPENFGRERINIWNKYSQIMQNTTMQEALAQGNNMAYSVASGARGKPLQLQAMLTTPGVYADFQGKPVPLFIRNSFAEGLRPAEYLAGTFGARSSVISTKVATAKGGDLCLAKGTLVRMADHTVKPIEDIQVGDQVLGSDKLGVLRSVTVTKTFDQGIKDVVEVTIPAGKGSKQRASFKCTHNHKFLTFAKNYPVSDPTIIPLKDFKTRNFLMTPTGFADVGYSDEPFALLTGLFMGDGVFPNCRPGDKSRCMFTCADDLLIQDTAEYLEELGLHWKQRKTNKIQYRVSKNGGYTHPFKDFVKSSGLQGLRHSTKRLPTDIHTWSNESVGQFVAGYLAADGCITHKTTDGKFYTYVSFTSVSQQLLEELKLLLKLRFGINSAEVFEIEADNKTGFSSEIPSYFLSIGSNKDVQHLLSLAPIPGVKGKLQKSFLENYSDSYTLLNDSLKVSKIKEAGKAHCYDIEVDHQDHLFVLACGVITSNSKQMVQASAPLVISSQDCGTSNGIDLSSDDDSLKGRVLQNDAGELKAGTVLDKQALSYLRKKGIEEVVARSPLTCSAKKGVCAKCTGVDARGRFRNIGDSVGIEAAQSIGEPITQMALNSKHTSGQSGGKKQYSGFDVINRIAQSPEVFPDRAIVAETDGRVEAITDAPQGGKYVTVNGTEHYIQPGYDVLVKPGAQLEAGDQLSDGVIDSGDIVRLRGLGEGRRFYSERLKQALDDSGVWADKRNTEMLARAALDHVQIDDNEGMGDFLPDDVVSYNALESSYIPGESTRSFDPSDAVGKFLEQPMLHYSIGTRITPRIAERIKKNSKSKIFASDNAPSFSPKMVRLRAAMHNNPDWLASQHTSYLKAQLNEAGMRGRDTNIESNSHFGPRLAVGKNFGNNVTESGEF
jgi:hypothetical protein